ncbi:hypothetical protein B0H12DRAFT_1230064 [Mycena haematopus]|nr:hypothetical protein B0H12DRAFT_1230064 [Mycena haematopus]
MTRGGDTADWICDPSETTKLVNYFYSQHSRFGYSGNPDKSLLNDAATHLASFGPPKEGGPKTASSIKSRWATLRKLRDYIQQVLQKTYPGASEWTYTHERGFNVTPESRDAWRAFVKLVDDIIPARAKDKYVFVARSKRSRLASELDMSAETTQLSMPETQSMTETQLLIRESQLANHVWTKVMSRG